ncbi:hypothetical protein I260019D6_12730 [Dorea longicatena]|uniref:DNA-processing protein DprA n=1 Tax=Dorea longicatena TaxID=88431 RepID=UPI0036F38652
MKRYIIALSELGIKNSDLISLLIGHFSEIKTMFDGESCVFDKNVDLIIYSTIFKNKERISEALSRADEILSINEKLGIKTTYYTALTYPSELAKINNPPAIIYYKGAEFNKISNKAIACVGTRKPTRLSYNAVNYLIPQWVYEDCSIISGLACGVDKISHQACVTAGGKTIAVLAHGLDMIYPKENTFLADRIVNSGGILMSEYPVGTKADKFRFVNRNRLIVGMSRAVVIFECDKRGGTMHNAEYAVEQKKPVFCPALGEEILEIQTGTKQLIDQKIATVIEQGRDIMGVMKAVGATITKNRMSNLQIKLNYLYSVISIIHQSIVLEATVKEMNLDISVDSDICNTLLVLLNEGRINIDDLISSLVENNIACIKKTLIFND